LKQSLSTTSINRHNDLSGAARVHGRLRKLILDGSYAPGTLLSQVELAEALGVSRTPLREALRMLQEEGLIEAERNQRARIPSFDPQVLDALYASRILHEVVGIRLTVAHLEQKDVEALEKALSDMDLAATSQDIDAWEEPHRRFHRLLVAYAGEQLGTTIAGYADRCEYYRRMYNRQMSAENPTHVWDVTATEHRSIVEACIIRDAEAASHRLALHLARTALTLLGQISPKYDPAAIKAALHMVGVDTSSFNAPQPRRRTRKRS
jgi:DNA-binding GntR family transcriptional regulator